MRYCLLRGHYLAKSLLVVVALFIWSFVCSGGIIYWGQFLFVETLFSGILFVTLFIDDIVGYGGIIYLGLCLLWGHYL